MRASKKPAQPPFDIDWFLTFSAGGESTQASYRYLLSKMEGLAGRPLASATSRDLDKLKARLRGMRSGLQHVRTLRMFYSRCASASRTPEEAFRYKQLADASVLKLKKPKLDPADILSPDEVSRVMNAALTQRDRALIGVLYECGPRISEALALDWPNVTHEEAVDGLPEMYVLWFPKVKVSGSEHQGFILDTLEALRDWLENHPHAGAGPLFCTASGERLTRGGAWRRVKAAARRAGVRKRVYLHAFRHARATHLLAAGWSEARVKKLLGWSPGSRQLDRYAHLTGNDVRRALLESKGLTVPKEIAPTFVYRREAVPPVPVKPVAGMAVPRPGPPTVPPEVAVMLLEPRVQAFLAALAASMKAAPSA